MPRGGTFGEKKEEQMVTNEPEVSRMNLKLDLVLDFG